MNNVAIEKLIDDLKNNPMVFITFMTKMKVQRIMACTKDIDTVPQDKWEDQNNFKLVHDSIIAVFDLQNDAWRSIRKDSILSYVVV